MVKIAKDMIKVIVFILLLIVLTVESSIIVLIMPWIAYKVTAYILIAYIILYLIVPLRGQGPSYEVGQGMILVTASVFVTMHAMVVWSHSYPSIHVEVVPFFLLLHKFNENMVRPVIEVDWGQVVLALTAIRLLIYGLTKISVLMKDLNHPS